MPLSDAEKIAHEIADDFEGRKLTKGQTACLSVRIAAALRAEYRRGIEDAAKEADPFSVVGESAAQVATEIVRRIRGLSRKAGG
jgi:hypothetical protein